RRVHRVPARPGTCNPLRRPDLRHRSGMGGGTGAFDPGRYHVRDGHVARNRIAERRQAVIHQRQTDSEDVMDRRKFLGSPASLGLALAAPPTVGRAAARELLVAEPVHSTGYLPMYIAMANGYFAESDINVKIVTIENGSGHTNAVLSGQAFAFIGGPEHNAFAKLKGAELRSVVHCVDRGNVYICARKGQEPKDTDWPAYFKGKSIALGPFGGTPNTITRYLLGKWKLDAKRDVTLHEMPNSAVPAGVRGGQATIGVTTEPMI